MTTGNWIALVATIVAAIGVTFGIYKHFRPRSTIPRTKLSISIQEPQFVDDIALPQHVHTRYYHLLAQNKGRPDAINCRVHLMGVWEEGNPEDLLGAGEISLRWAHKGIDIRHIAGKETAELDFFTQPKADQQRLNVAGVGGDADGLRWQYDPGTYVAKVRLAADNADSQDLSVKVEHSGDGPVIISYA